MSFGGSGRRTREISCEDQHEDEKGFEPREELLR